MSTSANPTDNKDFNATADGKPIPLVTEPFTVSTPGWCGNGGRASAIRFCFCFCRSGDQSVRGSKHEARKLPTRSALALAPLAARRADTQIPTGEACWYIDFSSLGLGLKNGSEVTLLIEYQGGDGSLFQCTDLVLLDNYTVPSNYTCAKPATGAGANSTAGGANTTAPNTTTNGNSSASATPSPSKGSGAEKLTAGAAAVLLAAAAALL